MCHTVRRGALRLFLSFPSLSLFLALLLHSKSLPRETAPSDNIIRFDVSRIDESVFNSNHSSPLPANVRGSQHFDSNQRLLHPARRGGRGTFPYPSGIGIGWQGFWGGISPVRSAQPKTSAAKLFNFKSQSITDYWRLSLSLSLSLNDSPSVSAWLKILGMADELIAISLELIFLLVWRMAGWQKTAHVNCSSHRASIQSVVYVAEMWRYTRRRLSRALSKAIKSSGRVETEWAGEGGFQLEFNCFSCPGLVRWVLAWDTVLFFINEQQSDKAWGKKTKRVNSKGSSFLPNQRKPGRAFEMANGFPITRPTGRDWLFPSRKNPFPQSVCLFTTRRVHGHATQCLTVLSQISHIPWQWWSANWWIVVHCCLSALRAEHVQSAVA